jgi:hypothetical protein
MHINNFLKQSKEYLKKEAKSLATGKIHDINICGLFKEDWKKNLPKIKKHLQEKIKKLEDKHL